MNPAAMLSAAGIPSARGPAAVRLPDHDGTAWALRDGRRTRRLPDREALITALRRGKGVVLVGTPGKCRFRAPEAVADLPDSCRWPLRSNACKSALMFLLTGLLLLGAGLLLSVKNLVVLGGLVCLIGALLALDGHRLRDPVLAATRTRTLFWLRAHPYPRRCALTALLLMLLAAAVQVWMQQQAGGMRPVWDQLGIVYPEVRDGALWRLFTGPFLHYSATHFISNLLGLVLIVPFAYGLVGPWCWAVLLLGCALGSACQILFGGSLHDTMGGISPGVNALFGLVAGVATLRPRLLPGGFGPVLLVMTLLGVAMAEVANPSAATAGHLGGLLVGLLVAGIIGAGIPRREDTFEGPERAHPGPPQVEKVQGEGAS